MTLVMDVRKMKNVINNVYILLVIAALGFAVAGSHLHGHSVCAAEAEARGPNERFATGPTVAEAVMALEGRVDLALDWE